MSSFSFRRLVTITNLKKSQCFHQETLLCHSFSRTPETITRTVAPTSRNLLKESRIHLYNPKKFLTSTTKADKKKPTTCWKCGKGLTVIDPDIGYPCYLLCGSCGVPQGESVCGGVTFFEVLGLPEGYLFEVERGAAATRRLQRRLHPDLFATRSREEQELSQELSSFVNKAFATLSNPIERGRYLLTLHGVEDPLGDVEKEITSDPMFLEEVMELNERLVELDSEEEWRKFREDNEITLGKLRRELEKAFSSKNIPEAKILLARMKYFDTLQGKLKDLKSKLGIVE